MVNLIDHHSSISNRKTTTFLHHRDRMTIFQTPSWLKKSIQEPLILILNFFFPFGKTIHVALGNLLIKESMKTENIVM